MTCPSISRLTAPNVMVLFITFLLFLVSANAFAATQSRAYNLNQRPAADVAAQIRDLYEEVNVTVVGQKIVARGETRSGFVVTPRMISPQNIELSIMSFEQDAPALPGYDTEALMTIRQVQPGQWVSLGGVDRSESRENSGIVYQVNGSENRSSEIRVRVDILP
ncbi:hypothetical protein [Marinobacter gelidimuriae]|uniref:hypothetical protein n=1 Tax=Marinobacter gelidimuriae TaxID=2739064 RepID=UPI000475DED8|nr:hypothetical protein [Marinobacter gelidimuriae]